MQEKHLTYDEIKLYLDTGELSDEYLGKVESISQHLGECEQCQSMLEKVILMDSVCEEDTLAYGIDLLKKEADIRRELFSEKIKKAEEEKRIRMLAESMRSVRPEQMNFSSMPNLSRQENFAGMANANRVNAKYLMIVDEELEEDTQDITSVVNKTVEKKQKMKWKPVLIGAGVLFAIVLIIAIGLLLI